MQKKKTTLTATATLGAALTIGAALVHYLRKLL